MNIIKYIYVSLKQCLNTRLICITLTALNNCKCNTHSKVWCWNNVKSIDLQLKGFIFYIIKIIKFPKQKHVLSVDNKIKITTNLQFNFWLELCNSNLCEIHDPDIGIQHSIHFAPENWVALVHPRQIKNSSTSVRYRSPCNAFYVNYFDLNFEKVSLGIIQHEITSC